MTRLFVVLVVVIEGKHQIADSTGAVPGYWAMMTNWDGQWYGTIATHGYPVDLPTDAVGQVVQNPWGFYPLYPMLVRGLMWMTGLSFALVGPAFSVVLGTVAVVVLFRLVQDALGTRAARITVLLTCTFMSAPALQAAYTESLALLLVSSCLMLLRRRHYAWTAVVIVLLALTRNVILAMGLVILVHGAARWRARSDEDFARSDRFAIGGLIALSVAATGLWPAIAGAVTGQRSAYLQTMAAWGREVRDPGTFFNAGSPTALVVFFATLLLFVGLLRLLRPCARRWGPELWGWSVAYPFYLMMATDLGTSTLRHLLLAFPLSLLAADLLRPIGPRVVRISILGLVALGGLALQWIWIANFFIVTTPGRQLFP